jgi:hypothetical protein
MERFFLELEPPPKVMASWPQVEVGGGFAGLRSAMPWPVSLGGSP